MPRESGSVNSLREAIVEIRFAAGDSHECVVDTGFEGALILPSAVAERLRLPIVARLVFGLVGGARMSADVALVDIEWLGHRREVEAIISESNDALIGTEMFEGATLVVNYADGLVSVSHDNDNNQSLDSTAERA